MECVRFEPLRQVVDALAGSYAELADQPLAFIDLLRFEDVVEQGVAGFKGVDVGQLLFNEAAGLLQRPVLPPAEDVAAFEEEDLVEDGTGGLDEGFLDAFTGAHSCILSGFRFSKDYTLHITYRNTAICNLDNWLPPKMFLLLAGEGSIQLDSPLINSLKRDLPVKMLWFAWGKHPRLEFLIGKAEHGTSQTPKPMDLPTFIVIPPGWRVKPRRQDAGAINDTDGWLAQGGRAVCQGRRLFI